MTLPSTIGGGAATNVPVKPLIREGIRCKKLSRWSRSYPGVDSSCRTFECRCPSRGCSSAGHGRLWPNLLWPNKSETVAGKGRKRAKFWASTPLHPSGLHPSGPHFFYFWAPHPFGAPPFRGRFGQSRPIRGWPKLEVAKVGQIKGWPKSGLAKIGQIRMAKTGLAKVGLSRSAGLGYRTRPMQTSPTVLSPMYSIKSSFN